MTATWWSAPVRSGRVARSSTTRSAPLMSPPTTTCITRRRLMTSSPRCDACDRRVPLPARVRVVPRRVSALQCHGRRGRGTRSPVCGITGLISRDARPDEAPVRRMNHALAHRGPDAEGLWSRGRAVLGHRRLSIIDLSPEATQPLLNEDGTIGVVVNGEIYNFVELREDLVRRGHVFRSSSDSEVVVHLYEEYGADCVAKLSGMFALALWDSARDRLLLARDRAGKKPLVYRRLPGGDLAFASEVHALVRAFPDVPVTPDLEAIDEYLTLQYVPAPRTAYRDIYKLPAAHLAIYER